ncbi:MAG TPA: hypothetical protein VI933_03985 [archaeon]|nr:hypothetical protein [archaeon]
MNFRNLLLSFVIGAVLFAPAALAYQSDGPTGLTSFAFGIVSSISDFFGKIFATPNLVVSDAKFSGDDLQITITNTGKAVANFKSDIVDAGIIDSDSNVPALCKSSGNYCVDNPKSGISCTASGGRCTTRIPKTGYGFCSCVFRPKTTEIQSIKLNAGQSTTITIKNVGAPKVATKYSLRIAGSGNIKEFATDKTIQPASVTTTTPAGGSQGEGQGSGQGSVGGNSQGQQGQQGQGATQGQSQGQGEGNRTG